MEFDWFLNLQNLRRLSLWTEKISVNFILKLFEQLKFFWNFHLYSEVRNIAIEFYKSGLDYESPYLFLSLDHSEHYNSPEHRVVYCKELDDLVQAVKSEELRLKEKEKTKRLFI